MSSARETDAARLVAIRVMRDLLTEADQQIRARMAADMLPGAREVAAVGEDRTPVGAVTRSKPGKDKAELRVVDVERFTRWAETFHPGQVTYTATVRPAFVKVILADTAQGREWCDENGEILGYPPGVEVVTVPGAASTLRVLPDDGAAEIIRAALAAGELSMADLVALPSGDRG